MKNQVNGYKNYEVIFTENKKYNPATRVITIHAINDYHATMLAHQVFGSFKQLNPQAIPSNKIKIESVVEVKEEMVQV